MKLEYTEVVCVQAKVAPRRGAWIETVTRATMATRMAVAPRRGAWIETGLTALMRSAIMGRAPQGRVD